MRIVPDAPLAAAAGSVDSRFEMAPSTDDAVPDRMVPGRTVRAGLEDAEAPRSAGLVAATPRAGPTGPPVSGPGSGWTDGWRLQRAGRSSGPGLQARSRGRSGPPGVGTGRTGNSQTARRHHHREAPLPPSRASHPAASNTASATRRASQRSPLRRGDLEGSGVSDFTTAPFLQRICNPPADRLRSRSFLLVTT